jgi:hypothetical protein
MNAAGEWIPLFPEEEIPRILRIVERCAGRLRKRKPMELENDLSDRLRDLIDQDPEFRDDVDAEIQREVPIYDRSKPRTKQLGRGDIKFLHGTGRRKPYPYFLIEAKRLHVPFPSGWDSLVSEYVTGNQGMMCFINARYSRNLASGGMLGYVFDGRVKDARDAVHDLTMKQMAKLQAVEPYGLTPVGGSAITAEKSHHSIKGKQFVIYHMFADVR